MTGLWEADIALPPRKYKGGSCGDDVADSSLQTCSGPMLAPQAHLRNSYADPSPTGARGGCPSVAGGCPHYAGGCPHEQGRLSPCGGGCPCEQAKLDPRNSGKVPKVPTHEGRTVRCRTGLSCGRFWTAEGCPSCGGGCPLVAGAAPANRRG
jgi:hypothetical protein